MTQTLSNDLLCQILENQVKQAETLGKIQGDVSSLSGPEGRVTALERKETRNFWMTTAIGPALLGLHAALRKFGIQI